MKNRISILFMMFIFSGLVIAQDGVKFQKLSWEKALERAKQKKTLVFLDAYTDWCAPCKRMDKQVFADEKVGDYFNRRFVNIKLDMEKGEGVEIAKKYAIAEFPTFLFVDGDGRVQHRDAGFYRVEQFMNLGKLALDTEKRLGALEDRFTNGDRNPEFLKDLAFMKLKIGDGSHEEVAQAFLEGEEDCRNCKSTSGIIRRIVKYLVDQNSQAICNHHFFK